MWGGMKCIEYELKISQKGYYSWRRGIAVAEEEAKRVPSTLWNFNSLLKAANGTLCLTNYKSYLIHRLNHYLHTQ